MIEVQSLKLKICVKNAMQNDHITPPHSVHNINYMNSQDSLTKTNTGKCLKKVLFARERQERSKILTNSRAVLN